MLLPLFVLFFFLSRSENQASCPVYGCQEHDRNYCEKFWQYTRSANTSYCKWKGGRDGCVPREGVQCSVAVCQSCQKLDSTYECERISIDNCTKYCGQVLYSGIYQNCDVGTLHGSKRCLPAGSICHF